MKAVNIAQITVSYGEDHYLFSTSTYYENSTKRQLLSKLGFTVTCVRDAQTDPSKGSIMTRWHRAIQKPCWPLKTRSKILLMLYNLYKKK